MTKTGFLSIPVLLAALAAPISSGPALASEQPVWEAPAAAAKTPNPLELNKNSIAAGKKVFDVQCFVCHGTGGKGDGPAAPGLQRKLPDFTDSSLWEQADGTLFWKISQGKAPMPTFETILSETDRWNVINFLRSLSENPKQEDAE